MTTPGDHHHDSDPDPTGIRALLSSLPDPGPMPEELVRRISASLQEEQRRRERDAPELVAAGPAAPGPAPATATDDHPGVVSLDRERQRRRSTRTLSVLGAAAAVAVAATVVTSQIFGGGLDGGLDVSAQYPRDNASDAGGGAAEERQDAMGGADEDAGAETDDAAGAPPPALAAVPEVLVVPGTFAVTRDGFADQVRQELSAWQDGATTTGATELAPDEAQTCARSVSDDLADRAEVVVTASTLDGVDSVLLVQTRPGPATAWVLPVSCARGPAELLHGPIVLD